MNVSIEKNKECVVVNIEGRLDTTNYQSLEEQFLQLIADDHLRIIVDCAKLDYVSSSGLRVFLVALKTLTKKQGKLFFCHFNDELIDIFEVSGFINVFNVCNTKEDAFSECFA
jgi:anti-anti-sigma factor